MRVVFRARREGPRVVETLVAGRGGGGADVISYRTILTNPARVVYVVFVSVALNRVETNAGFNVELFRVGVR